MPQTRPCKPVPRPTEWLSTWTVPSHRSWAKLPLSGTWSPLIFARSVRSAPASLPWCKAWELRPRETGRLASHHTPGKWQRRDFHCGFPVCRLWAMWTLHFSSSRGTPSLCLLLPHSTLSAPVTCFILLIIVELGITSNLIRVMCRCLSDEFTSSLPYL